MSAKCYIVIKYDYISSEAITCIMNWQKIVAGDANLMRGEVKGSIALGCVGYNDV